MENSKVEITRIRNELTPMEVRAGGQRREEKNKLFFSFVLQERLQDLTNKYDEVARIEKDISE